MEKKEIKVKLKEAVETIFKDDELGFFKIKDKYYQHIKTIDVDNSFTHKKDKVEIFQLLEKDYKYLSLNLSDSKNANKVITVIL